MVYPQVCWSCSFFSEVRRGGGSGGGRSLRDRRSADGTRLGAASSSSSRLLPVTSTDGKAAGCGIGEAVVGVGGESGVTGRSIGWTVQQYPTPRDTLRSPGRADPSLSPVQPQHVEAPPPVSAGVDGGLERG